MAKEVIAVFDIGKTNKKFFLFDTDFREVYREYTRLEETTDDDGYPCEDITALQNWIKDTFHRVMQSEEYSVKAVNFSSYGASFVHLDDRGNIVTPLYNYTKPMEEEIIDQFYANYGPITDFSMATGTSNSGMLNSGMQLYWLKHKKPELFSRIRYALHLPQYLSYIFTGIAVSEYTSIGCHTALWNYAEEDYHPWVYKEGIHRILPAIVPTGTSINTTYKGRRVKIGVGIHDSSSALLPYIRSIRKEFLLLSTGTWSITLNPFSGSLLNRDDIAANCINYMRIDGDPVKASRLFLGHMHNKKVGEMAIYFQMARDHHKTVKFDPALYQKTLGRHTPLFNFDQNEPAATWQEFASFEEAYHQLMKELTDLQVKSIKRAAGNEGIKRLYIDGGFANNEIFLELLSLGLDNMKIRTTNASLGSALGAAIVISDADLDSKFLKKNYALKKHKPLILR